jgi:hydroxyacylglutathione hydrolase
MRIVPVPCLSDNYAYLLTHANQTLIVDASEAEPVLAALPTDANVVGILATHHHHDHVGGNEGVRAKLGELPVYGHVSDRGRIPAQTNFLEEGETFELCGLSIRAIHIPGHTLGAVAYVVTGGDGPPAVFTGDTLFLAGCGRLFEGDPPMMHASLQKLAALDPATQVYCGHEYTESNLRFAAHCEPSNTAIEKARAHAASLRAQNKPTVPATLGEELTYNPFLRTGSAEIRETLGIPASASPEDALGAIRKAKDNFR